MDAPIVMGPEHAALVDVLADIIDAERPAAEEEAA